MSKLSGSVPERLRTALTYPVSGETSERPLLAAWILVLLSFLIPVLPLIPLLGYLVAALAASARGDEAPPFVERPRRLAWRGVQAVAVLVVYLAVPAVVLVVTVYGALTLGDGPDGRFFSTVTIYAGSTAALVIAATGAYLCPIALGRLGDDGRLRAAFDPSVLRSVGGNAAYFANWVTGSLALGFATLAGVTAAGVPGIGPVVASLLVAYGSILAAYYWGRGLARAS